MFLGSQVLINEAKLSLNSVISTNSGNMINHETLKASWTLTQNVADSRPFNDKYLCKLVPFTIHGTRF